LRRSAAGEFGMTKRRVLLTGGSGLLAINWACAIREGWDVVLGTHRHSVNLKGVASCRLDLGNQVRLESQIGQLAPDLIVNTAGLTDVDRCEADPALANLVNAELARNVAIVAARIGAGLIHISTDHLFAGDQALGTEEDVPCPLNQYARSKLLGEALVQEACARVLVVRTNFFAWGHAGRQSFSDWIIYSLRAGKTIPLFDDVHFTPILADVLALTAHDLAARGASGIFNITGDQRVSKYEFGCRLAERFELPGELIRRSQMDHARLRAPRPQDMSMANAKTRGHLGTSLGSLDDYFEALRIQEQQGRRLELLAAVADEPGSGAT
jgi:dTDP-4-dehydrorhamnose reductase